MKIKNAVVLGALALAMGNAQAALFDRGGGLIYDDVLNITWLQDANYAKTSGYDADGKMNWIRAYTWATDLIYGGFDDWRLPVAESRFSNVYSFSYSGEYDLGQNIKSPTSELSYMFYVNLGLVGDKTVTGASRSQFGVSGTGFLVNWDAEYDIGVVDNIVSGTYWYGSVYPQGTTKAIYMNYAYGEQFFTYKTTEFYAWAVRDGDVTPTLNDVPEPSSMVLLGLALAGLGATRRTKSI